MHVEFVMLLKYQFLTHHEQIGKLLELFSPDVLYSETNNKLLYLYYPEWKGMTDIKHYVQIFS